VIRERGALTVAAFMDLALYHPDHGYYARQARPTGRAGDFFTSVDVGALFGELLELQIAEMADILRQNPANPENPENLETPFDLVDAGAGNGQLAADILRAAEQRHPDLFQALRLHLVETSPEARRAQRAVLGPLAPRLATSSAQLPPSFEGVLIANELLDAMPVHQVVARADGLREIYVDVEGDRALTMAERPPSTSELGAYLERLNISLEPGWRVEINLRATEWVRDAARRLRRGFIVLIDYGHEASELYSLAHAGGTLTSFSAHRMTGPEAAWPAPWLLRPGEQDLTAHVDFTSVRRAAEAEGLVTLGFLDQTYFLMGLVADRLRELEQAPLERRLTFKTLLMPGGLGGTMKVLILGKNVGAPPLVGCSYRMRVT
jgi:SAM-dependent MidA family methyltransferase